MYTYQKYLNEKFYNLVNDNNIDFLLYKILYLTYNLVDEETYCSTPFESVLILEKNKNNIIKYRGILENDQNEKDIHLLRKIFEKSINISFDIFYLEKFHKYYQKKEYDLDKYKYNKEIKEIIFNALFYALDKKIKFLTKQDLITFSRALIDFNILFNFEEKENEYLVLKNVLEDDKKNIILKTFNKHIPKIANDIFMRSYLFIDQNFRNKDLDENILENYVKNEIKNKIKILFEKENINSFNFIDPERVSYLSKDTKIKQIKFNNLELLDTDLNDIYSFYILVSREYIKILRNFSTYDKKFIEDNIFIKEDKLYTLSEENLINYLREN